MERRSFLTLPVAAAAMAAPTPPLAAKLRAFGTDWQVVASEDGDAEEVGTGYAEYCGRFTRIR